jgi:hypothetical protein
MYFYHVTRDKNVPTIMARGFRDFARVLGCHENGKPLVVKGVWFSDKPTFEGGYGDPPRGWTILRIKVPVKLAKKYEVINEGCPYREWCIPAKLINQYEVVPVKPRS